MSNTAANIAGIVLFIVAIWIGVEVIIKFIKTKENEKLWLKYYLDPDEGPYYDTWYTYWRFKDKFFSRKI